MEELIPFAWAFTSEDYEVLLFEGPGQGGVLEAGLPMTAQWELPVKAILDFFQITSATGIGVSLGGYLMLGCSL